jgi:hypothetical protein
VLVLLVALAVVLVLLYLATLGRQPDQSWQRFRHRFRERRRQLPPEQVIDPTFRFDQPSTDVQEGEHRHEA